MIRRALPWLVESGSDGMEGSEREVDLPLDGSEEVDLPLDWSDREVGCGLDRERRVERGREEEKAVGVAEGCLKNIWLSELYNGGDGENGHLGVDDGCLGRKACSTSLQVDEEESVLKIRV